MDGIDITAQHARHTARAQDRHDGLMASLEGLVHDEAALIDWLQDYAAVADARGVVGTAYGFVAATPEGAGYAAGEARGLPREAYEDPRTLARWLVGQAIEHMSRGMPPHERTLEKFATEYRRLKGENAAPEEGIGPR